MRVFKCKVEKFFKTQTTLSAVLQRLTNFKVEELADAASKGAVWIQKNSRGKILRIRRIDENVMPKDLISFYFDKKVLNLPTLKKLELLYEDRNYGIWIKPAGVVSQGSQASDHASLLRYVEIVKKRKSILCTDWTVKLKDLSSSPILKMRLQN